MYDKGKQDQTNSRAKAAKKGVSEDYAVTVPIYLGVMYYQGTSLFTFAAHTLLKIAPSESERGQRCATHVDIHTNRYIYLTYMYNTEEHSAGTKAVCSLSNGCLGLIVIKKSCDG